MTKAILVAGTASHVGKSWMATALCRWLRRRGLRVAPFKAQNMSLNSYPCRAGGEIGRAQVVQAEACGLEPTTDMNPLLLKPSGEMGCQVVVDGKVWRNLSARDYYTHFDFLLERVLAAYGRLAEQYEVIVMEGAGSAVELNLKERDLVNLGLAVRLNAPVLLVADIDRGGVFASVVGTFALLEGRESELVRSFAVNRFRGDPGLFEEGRRMLEERAGRPCVGVFPYLEGVTIDAEDSVSLPEPARGPAAAQGGRPTSVVVVVRLPRISNFTDFALLPGVRYITEPTVEQPDVIILPGSKNTIADLAWLRARGLDHWILEQYSRGAEVWGICGGYQMLGRSIADPLGVESAKGWAEGLGLLPADTVLEGDKTTRVVEAESAATGRRFRAYEIHMGRTTVDGVAPFALVDGRPEGARAAGVLGTYLHGALEDAGLVEELLGTPVAQPSKDAAYDRLACWFEQHADVRRFEELYL
jgi:adenosylcobyric acid synthase